MMNLRTCGMAFTARMLLLSPLLACFSTAGLAATDITGSARNLSRSQPASGDDVILLRLDQGMQEESRAKTDAQGAFSLHVLYPDKLYLVRVIHQGVNYDQQASAGDALSIQVFDAAPQVRGVAGSIEILRTGANGNLLHVSDMYEIKNDSSPPSTQASEHTFEVFLPANAKLDSVLAAGPGKIGVMISAAPVPGEPGHFTVNFPLRPGATKFAFNYDLPYKGHASFQTRRAYPLQQLAVMIPPTMKFSSRSPAFASLATGSTRYQVQTANQLTAGEGPSFEVSGTGALPPLADQAKSQAPSRSPALPYPTVPNPSVSSSARAALPSSSLAGAVSRSPQPQSSSQSLVLGVLGAVILASCGFMVWRARKSRRSSGATAPLPPARQTQRSATLMEALKEELYRLEADRLRGSISGEEYASTKRALQETVKRAVARAS